MKPARPLYLLLIILSASTMTLIRCNPGATPSLEATGTPASKQAATSINSPAQSLGSRENPLIMALDPATTEEMIPSGEAIAAQLSEATRLTVVTILPDSYGALVEALGAGNAHIGWLPPIAYFLAHQKGYADVALLTTRAGSEHYGIQFIANVDNGFRPYFDPVTNQNTADAAIALAQFEGKKPCWDDPLSASGYAIPNGILVRNNVTTKPAAFVQGHNTVVRAIYAKGICNFGATYIDARTAPSVAQDFPDVMDKVVVIWRTDAIIPYDNVSYAASLPENIRQELTDTFLQMADTEEGLAALKAVYRVEGLKIADDSIYDEFRYYFEVLGLDLADY